LTSRMRISCVQLAAYPVDQAEEGLAHALEMVGKAAREKPDLVVLPECIYPAYFLAEWSPEGFSQRLKEVEREFQRAATRHGCYLAVGMAEEREGQLYNSAFLFAPEGDKVATAQKQFLWHFDSRWFACGELGSAVETPWGKVGMMVCADGRTPEIPRILALRGARLVLDLTNLVSTGADPSALTNPQVEYLLKVRAVENRQWIAVANKVGLEHNSVLYCGRSGIISPEGEVLAMAGSKDPEVVTVEIDMDDVEDTVHGVFDPLRDRRPSTYGHLTREHSRLAIGTLLEEPMVPARHQHRVAAVQLDTEVEEAELLRAVQGYLHRLAVEGVEVIVFPKPKPRPPSEIGAWKRVVDAVQGMTAVVPVVVAFTWPEEAEPGLLYHTTWLFYRGEVIGKYRANHPDRLESRWYTPGDLGYPVFETPVGRIGMMAGWEGLLFEPARILALNGAEVILWPCRMEGQLHDDLARARAMENRVFVAVANAVGEGASGLSLLVNPDGARVGQAFEGKEQAVGAQFPLALARCKTVVTGTDVIFDRCPDRYGELVEE